MPIQPTLNRGTHKTNAIISAAKKSRKLMAVLRHSTSPSYQTPLLACQAWPKVAQSRESQDVRICWDWFMQSRLPFGHLSRVLQLCLSRLCLQCSRWSPGLPEALTRRCLLFICYQLFLGLRSLLVNIDTIITFITSVLKDSPPLRQTFYISILAAVIDQSSHLIKHTTSCLKVSGIRETHNIVSQHTKD